MKRLYRSRKNRMLSGILGGIGEFFNIDPTIIRVAYILLMVLTAFFPFFILYFIFYFVIPEEDNY
ncbi:phage shock protein C [Pullulanibacillus pueri]|uniref:Phage shock protein PspC N-terminal domain-containing protein n=1 Tax=Pullulanibacillus pueri TaxID=1437324 RepID=A0A8J3ESM8_9BACL|nr:PspC domain-containing protein [Pullulanibacillus pueri]MBM7684194.1 phage shock protein C [Pullulanibacillus pueri]GGH88921.1 hypothetical protein GCM10007096_42350 [Pullulanibacillus pueri]